MNKKINLKWRSANGSTIAEFAPALFVLFLLIIFPMVNLIYLTVGYSASWYLNNLEVRELAVRTPANSSTALSEVDTRWANSPLARFVHATAGDIQHPGGVQYDPSPTDNTNTQAFVKLSTQVTIKPFLNIAVPFIKDVPGVGAPITFVFFDRRTQEEKGND